MTFPGPFGIRTRPAARLAPPRGKTTWHLDPTSWESCHPAHHCVAYERGLSTATHALGGQGSGRSWDRRYLVRSYVRSARSGPDLLGHAVYHVHAHTEEPCVYTPCAYSCGHVRAAAVHVCPFIMHS